MAVRSSISHSDKTFGKGDIIPFGETLANHRLQLERGYTTTLQINVGLLCNQACRHCHLNAGPKRAESMDRETLDEVVTFAGRSRFKTIDITGGSPELHPHLKSMIQHFSPLTDRLLVRSNLSALEESNPEQLIDIFREYRVGVVASFPSLNKGQAESQRGKGIFEKSLRALQRLNRVGYGKRGTRLELDLISNPTGAFLPPPQKGVEERFRAHLQEKWGIVFNNLFILANVPLGRFRQWLHDSGNFEKYLERLFSSFNPCVVQGLMCRRLVSVAWDGYLFDCDFNLAAGLFMGDRKTHISEVKHPPQPGSTIPVGDHCYACAAGSGST